MRTVRLPVEGLVTVAKERAIDEVVICQLASLNH